MVEKKMSKVHYFNDKLKATVHINGLPVEISFENLEEDYPELEKQLDRLAREVFKVVETKVQ